MSAQTGISWCDSTFNPWIGCTKVSPACDHCYAERDMAIRRKRVEWGAGKPRSRTSAANWKLPERWNNALFVECSECSWRGDEKDAEKADTGGRGLLTRFRDTLLCPTCGAELRAARRRVFCASLADVFDNEVDREWRMDLFALIAATPNLDWLLLTKRIGNAQAMFRDVTWPGFAGAWLANVWLGATVVNQEEADRDVPKLLSVPAAVRFLSIEPMLEEIDLHRGGFSLLRPLNSPPRSGPRPERIHWVIAGGESGPHARRSEREWFRSLRDQCQAAGVPFHFKQWGEWRPNFYTDAEGHEILGTAWPDRMGKKAAGRDLDGRTWDEFPRSPA